MLIQGDNLDTLKTLLPFHAGQLKCVSDGLPAFDGAEDGEEFQCAQAIDSLPGVKFWLRSVTKHADSFWLPTATDTFHPDFVARLYDDRIMVIEYQGALLAGGGVDDTNVKRAIGRLWEKHTDGKGVFVMIEKWLGGRNMRGQLRDKIASWQQWSTRPLTACRSGYGG